MGYMVHHAIVVTAWDDAEAERLRGEAVACGCAVSELVASPINGDASFLIAPDGSKMGWEDDRRGNESRDKFVAFLRKSGIYCDWVEVQYGDDGNDTCVIRDSDHAEPERPQQ